LKKARRVTEKVSFDDLLSGALRLVEAEMEFYMLCPLSLSMQKCTRKCPTEEAADRMETQGPDTDQRIRLPCCTDRVHPEVRVDLGELPAALRCHDAENGPADNPPLRRPCENPVDPIRNPDASDVQVVGVHEMARATGASITGTALMTSVTDRFAGRQTGNDAASKRL
jgi:hypothetical protein